MSKRSNKLLLTDMLEAALKIRNYTKGMDFELFMESDLVRDAVARNFEIIGEVSNRLDTQFKNQNFQIDWIRISGFRNLSFTNTLGLTMK